MPNSYPSESPQGSLSASVPLEVGYSQAQWVTVAWNSLLPLEELQEKLWIRSFRPSIQLGNLWAHGRGGKVLNKMKFQCWQEAVPALWSLSWFSWVWHWENWLFPSENPNPPPNSSRIPGAILSLERAGMEGRGERAALRARGGSQGGFLGFWNVLRGPLALLECLREGFLGKAHGELERERINRAWQGSESSGVKYPLAGRLEKAPHLSPNYNYDYNPLYIYIIEINNINLYWYFIYLYFIYLYHRDFYVIQKDILYKYIKYEYKYIITIYLEYNMQI